MNEAELTKRQREILERLEQGMSVKRIATDMGISRNAVYQHIDRLRRRGTLPESYTPSGQPPAGLPQAAEGLQLGSVVPSPGFGSPLPGGRKPSELAKLRRPAVSGQTAGDAHARLVGAAIANGDVAALAYELGRLDATGGEAMVIGMIEAALERFAIVPSEIAPHPSPPSGPSSG